MEAKFYPLVEKMNEGTIDQLPSISAKQAGLMQDIKQLQEQENQFNKNRIQAVKRKIGGLYLFCRYAGKQRG